MIPEDVWQLVSEQYLMHERTPFLLLRLSQVCRSSRPIFSSARIWAHLNPCKASEPIDHFLSVLSRHTEQQRKDLMLVWNFVDKLFEPSSRYLLGLRLRAKEIPDFSHAPSEYYKLGLLVATSVLFWNIKTQFPLIDDFDIMFCSVQILPSTYCRASPRLQGSRALAIMTARTEPPNTQQILGGSRLFSYDREAISASLQNASAFLQKWSDDEEIVIACANQKMSHGAITLASERLSNDENFVRQLLACNGKLLAEVQGPLTSKLRSDRQLVLRAISGFSYNLCLFENIDRDLLISFLSQNRDPTVSNWSQSCRLDNCQVGAGPVPVHFVLDHLRDQVWLYNDREFIKILVSWLGAMLKLASPELQNDPEIVRLAVSNHGLALEFASHRLQRCHRIVKVACANHGSAVAFAPHHKNSASFIRDLVEKDGRAYEGASETIKNDLELLSMAMDTHPRAILAAPPEARLNRELVYKAVCEGVILDLSNFQDDRELITAALRHRAASLSTLDAKWSMDPEMVHIAVEVCPLEFYHAVLDRSSSVVLQMTAHFTAFDRTFFKPHPSDETLYSNGQIVAFTRFRRELDASLCEFSCL